LVKNIVKYLATLAVIALAYTIYQLSDDSGSRAAQKKPYQPAPVVRRTQQSTTRPAGSTTVADKGFTFRGTNIPPGKAPTISIYDSKGREKIQYRSDDWEPISDNEFHVNDLEMRMLLPGGQLVHVWADEGQVRTHRTEGGNMDPKSGWLKGNVRIFIDRTTPEWRKEHPDLAEPDQHPEQVVKIWLEEVDFDLDLARIESQGPILLQSGFAELEGKGLELVWNEVSRQITTLKIAEGKRAIVRGEQLGSFQIASDVVIADEPGPEPALVTELAQTPVEDTPADLAQAGAPDNEAKELAFPDLEGEDERLPESRVDTYQIEFHDDVIAMQKEGIRVAGSLRANMLRLIYDMGAAERDAVEHGPEKDSAKNKDSQPIKPTSPKPLDTSLAASKKQGYLDLRWKGSLTVSPLTETEAREPDDPRRLHVIAVGDPVVVRDRKQNEAKCHELEYHDETKQIWLRGTAEAPVRTRLSENRELVGETIFFDRKAGIARIEGPGRMTDELTEADNILADERENVDIQWSRAVEIQFDQISYEVPNPKGGPPTPKRREYIRSAVFTGKARFAQANQSINADRIEALFRKPDPKQPEAADSMTAPEEIVAIGHVLLISGSESVTCDRLEADMTLDETGQAYPRLATAFGNVIARQGEQEIRARDRLTITTKSVPRPVPEEKRSHYETLARQHNIQPGSPRWVAFEKKLKNRRQTAIETMRAIGEVSAADPKSGLDLGADTLECTFGKEREISHAFIAGTEATPAHVDTGEFYINGTQIIIDTPTQSVDLPGDGLLRFFTQQDLDGQPVDDPIPVTVTWQQRMALRGERNVATFSGEVRARTRNTTVDCNELRVDFRDLPKERADKKVVAQTSVPQSPFGPLADIVSGRRKQSKSLTSRAADRIRKRPVYLHAIGDAVIESRAYQDLPRVTGGLVSRLWVNNVLEPLQPKTDQPRPNHMVSRLRIAGPKIGIDLIQEHLGVEGAGNLLIEDYRLPGQKKRRTRASSELASANFGALESSGPSQTAFTWKTSMLYLNNRGIAMFDKDVYMQHVAGSKMVLSKAEARVMNFDLEILLQIEGREVSMTCDNLLANFERENRKKRDGASPLGGAARLTAFRATGQSVRIEQDEYSAQGTLARYDRSSGIVELTGSPRAPAQIMKLDETGKPYIARSELIKWNQKSGQVLLKKTTMLATGR